MARARATRPSPSQIIDCPPVLATPSSAWPLPVPPRPLPGPVVVVVVAVVLVSVVAVRAVVEVVAVVAVMPVVPVVLPVVPVVLPVVPVVLPVVVPVVDDTPATAVVDEVGPAPATSSCGPRLPGFATATATPATSMTRISGPTSFGFFKRSSSGFSDPG